MATTAAGTPYVEATDTASDYPTVSLSLANRIDTVESVADGRLDAIEANNWVTTARINASAVTTAKIADSNVTPAKMSVPLLRSSLYLPGTSGNYVSCPDSAGVSVTGSIDIVAQIKMNDWTPASNGCFVSRWLPSGNQRAWRFEVDTGGKLSFIFSADGSATTGSALSTVATGLTDGTWAWVRVTRNSSNGVVKFYLNSVSAGLPTSWTQLGADVTVATGAMFDGTATLDCGAISAGTNNLLTGRIGYVEVRNGIDGTPVAVVDFRNGVSTRHRDEYGNVHTVNGSAWAQATEVVTA